MSDILESSAVITVKKTFNQFAKFYGFEVLAKMLQAVYQSDLNKLCQSNIKEYILRNYYRWHHNNFLQMTHLYYKHEHNIRAKSGALCWKLWSDYMTEISFSHHATNR